MVAEPRHDKPAYRFGFFSFWLEVANNNNKARAL